MDSLHDSSVEIDLSSHNGNCLSLQKHGPLFSLDSFSYSNMKEKMINFYGNDSKNKDEKPLLVGNIAKHLPKKVQNKYFFL